MRTSRLRDRLADGGVGEGRAARAEVHGRGLRLARLDAEDEADGGDDVDGAFSNDGDQ